MITLARAEQIADAAFEAAAAQGMTRLAVVVTDAGGDIRCAMRADGQGAYAVAIAQAKAQSALGFRMSTLKLAGHFGNVPASTIGIAGATGGRFVPIGGGVVVVDADGHTLGAAAVAGGAPEADDALIRAALKDAGLEALP